MGLELSRSFSGKVSKRAEIPFKKANGKSKMKDENDYMKHLNDVKSQLYLIKVLLLILIDLCLLGFYGISRSMWDDVAGTTTGIIEVLMVPVVLISPVILFVWRTAIVSPSEKNPKIDEES